MVITAKKAITTAPAPQQRDMKAYCNRLFFQEKTINTVTITLQIPYTGDF